MTTSYIDLDYKKFPPLFGISVIIDENTLLFRSYDIHYDILSDRPSYFSTYSNAKEYSNFIKDRNLGAFLPKREINLLDIRYIKSILNEMILERKSNNKDIINDYLTIALSFGLINLKEQLKLYKLRYPNYKNDIRYKNIKKYIEKNNVLDYYSKKLNINPVESHLFSNDVFSVEDNQTVKLVHSTVRSGPPMPGVLIVAGNKTYGRHKKITWFGNNFSRNY
jgi:hypothetical protein